MCKMSQKSPLILIQPCLILHSWVFMLHILAFTKLYRESEYQLGEQCVQPRAGRGNATVDTVSSAGT